MISHLRERFNREFSPARYAAFVDAIQHRVGVPVEFRLSETPCFIPAALLARLDAAAQELIAQLVGNSAYLMAADAVVPNGCRPAHGEDKPTFMQVDFGFVEGASGLEPRLVELQAFPSLYGFQLVLGEISRDVYGFPETHVIAGGLSHDDYIRLIGRAIVGPHDPNEVVLVEIDPARQKTRPDFEATDQLWGVRAIDLGDLVTQGRRVFARRDGALTPVRRIYNRVIPDELERKGRTWPFDLAADLDVEWAGGPDWFFRISKFSIPWLRHESVPETHYLSDVPAIRGARDEWLLKPLFSFAGGGIIFAPTDADLAAIPPDSRQHYILQERVAFTPTIDTPHGPTQLEVRLM
ncbi:MAG TPA: hypothetical protein VFB99_25540, partial [Vicinamibacterales bacterium]|nr:hypothetical protein [Vicinamibacterales bacterium]